MSTTFAAAPCFTDVAPQQIRFKLAEARTQAKMLRRFLQKIYSGTNEIMKELIARSSAAPVAA